MNKAYNYIKDKAVRAWAWTKRNVKKVLIGIGVVGVATAATLLINPEIPPAEYITAPENNTYKIGVLNYNAFLSTDITSDEPLKYELNGTYISFKPISIKWDGTETKTIKTTMATINEKNYNYKDAFGTGIDIDMNFGDRVFEKIVKINSLKDLGEIPKDAEYLEIEFEVKTNMIIDGWNKYSDFEITDKVRIGDYSYIEPAHAWDSYLEEVCEDILIDDIDTLVEEYITECETLINRVQIKSFLSENNGKLYLTKQIPVEWLKSAQYPISTDVDVTYGTASEFEATIAIGINVAEIGTDKFVVCYHNDTNNDADCRVATVSGTTFTWGTEAAADNGQMATGPVSVGKVDDDKFVVCFKQSGTSLDCESGFVSTRTITYQDQIGVEESNNWNNHDVCQLDTNKFVVVAVEHTINGDGSAWACTVDSGDGTIACGAENIFDAAAGWYLGDRDISCDQLGTDKFVLAYEDDASSDNGKAFVGTVSTTTITFGAESIFNAAATRFVGVAKLDTDKFIVTYEDDGDASNDGKTRAVTVSTRTIGTWGTEAEFEDGLTEDTAVTQIDTDKVLIAYSDGGDSGKGKSSLSTVSTTTITPGTPEEFEAGDTGGLLDLGVDIDLISENKVVICFQDDADSDKGKCIIGDLAAAPTGTNMQINIGDDWKAVDAVQINIGDAWKAVESMQINIGDSWKVIY